MAGTGDEKLCAGCGRRFAWRKKWARHWDQVRYCSERCRRHKPGAIDRGLEDAIRRLLARRGGSICPSEAARAQAPEDWRALMERTRQAGRRLAAAGEIVVLQRGRPVDPSDARGAIRFGRGPGFDAARGEDG